MQAFGTWHANTLRQRFHSRSSQLEQRLLMAHDGARAVMQQAHLLLSAYLFNGTAAQHRLLLHSINSTLDSPAEEAKLLPTQPSSSKSAVDVAARDGSGAAVGAKKTSAAAVPGQTAPAGAAGSPESAVVPAPDQAGSRKPEEPRASAPSGARAAVEAVWKKSHATGKWQLKLQQSGRQRAADSLLPPSPSTPAGQHEQGMAAVLEPLPGVTACTAGGLAAEAGAPDALAPRMPIAAGSGGPAGTTLPSNSTDSAAGVKPAVEGNVLELLNSVTQLEVIPEG